MAPASGLGDHEPRSPVKRNAGDAFSAGLACASATQPAVGSPCLRHEMDEDCPSRAPRSARGQFQSVISTMS